MCCCFYSGFWTIYFLHRGSTLDHDFQVRHAHGVNPFSCEPVCLHRAVAPSAARRCCCSAVKISLQFCETKSFFSLLISSPSWSSSYGKFHESPRRRRPFKTQNPPPFREHKILQTTASLPWRLGISDPKPACQNHVFQRRRRCVIFCRSLHLLYTSHLAPAPPLYTVEKNQHKTKLAQTLTSNLELTPLFEVV